MAGRHAATVTDSHGASSSSLAAARARAAEQRVAITAIEHDPAKFAHLPGGGVGPWRPPLARRIAAGARAAAKPALIGAAVLLAAYVALFVLAPRVAGFGGVGDVLPVPKVESSAAATRGGAR